MRADAIVRTSQSHNVSLSTLVSESALVGDPLVIVGVKIDLFWFVESCKGGQGEFIWTSLFRSLDYTKSSISGSGATTDANLPSNLGTAAGYQDAALASVPTVGDGTSAQVTNYLNRHKYFWIFLPCSEKGGFRIKKGSRK